MGFFPFKGTTETPRREGALQYLNGAGSHSPGLEALG